MQTGSACRAGAMLFVAIISLVAAGCAAGRSAPSLEAVGAQLAHLKTCAQDPVEPPLFSGDPTGERFARPAAQHPIDTFLGSETGTTGRFSFAASHWSHDVPMLADFADPTRSETRVPRRAPLPGFWETVDRDLRDWPRVFWKDTKDVFSNRRNLVILGLTYGGALALQQSGPDDTVEDSFRTHATFKKDFRDVFGAIGNPGTHFGIAGLWYLAGQQRQDEKTYSVATKLFRALALNGVVTLLGQAATWEDTPNGEWGTLPSGHTSSTFTFASVMHHEYGPAVGLPLYALGVATAYARLEDGEHYLSDVVMGGVLGLVIGHTVANDGEPPQLFGGTIAPYADPVSGATGIAWVKRIP